MFAAARVGDATAHGCAIATGSCNVFINSVPAAIVGKSLAHCALHGGAPIATGSGRLLINSLPAGRLGDTTGCGAAIVCGSHNVFID